MDVTLTPSPLSGTLPAIPSKSDAHRALICAALADRPTALRLPRTSADIDATCACLEALGAGAVRRDGTVTVTPIRALSDRPLLDCGESGSTLRFLLPVAAALCPAVRFTGRGRLPERPIGALKAAMEFHGVSFSAERLPFDTTGQLTGGAFSLPGNISSQYVTGLLLALPLTAGGGSLTLTTPLESAAYVDITLHTLRRFGIRVDITQNGYDVPGGQAFRSPGELAVDGDWSNAAFFLAAGALTAPVSLTGLDARSPQGDKAVLEVLHAFGAEVSISNGTVFASPRPLRGITLDVSEIPDLLPVLAAVAACAVGETRFVNAARLRLKESDRLSSTAAMLRSLGAETEELPDGLIVRGGPLSGGTVDGCNDHRIVMAAAVAAARCGGPVTIRGAEAVNKSYPGFWEDYKRLGGELHVL